MKLYRPLVKNSDGVFQPVTWDGLNTYGRYDEIVRLLFNMQQQFPHREYRIEEHIIGHDPKEQEQSRLD